MRVPRGFRDILPTEARELHAMRRQLMASFASYGYVPLDPPMVEFAESTATVDERRMLRFLDRDGRLLTLRPDITTAVARVVAQRYATTEHALRLAYFNAVFREEPSMRGSEREYDQAGIELIGAGGLRADAEVIALLASSLAACGLAQADLDVGHVGYLAGFLAELAPAARERAADLARRGDLVAALELFPAARREVLERGLRTRIAAGGSAEREAQRPGSAGDDPAAREAQGAGSAAGWRSALEALSSGAPAASAAALDELARLAPLLSAAGVPTVRFDLGFIPALPYYSGVVFQVTAPGLGFAVAAGGRYDGLLARFGADRPATGFGIAVPHLHQALIDAGWRAPSDGALVVLLPRTGARGASSAKDDAATLACAAALRARGMGVAIDEVADAAGQPLVRATAIDSTRVEHEGAVLTLDAFAARLGGAGNP